MACAHAFTMSVDGMIVNDLKDIFCKCCGQPPFNPSSSVGRARLLSAWSWVRAPRWVLLLFSSCMTHVFFEDLETAGSIFTTSRRFFLCICLSTYFVYLRCHLPQPTFMLASLHISAKLLEDKTSFLFVCQKYERVPCTERCACKKVEIFI